MKPAAHAVHALLPDEAEYRPGAHDEQALEEADAWKKPASQTEHDELELDDATYPIGQEEHCTAPMEAEYVPGEQATQAVPSLSGWKNPTVHVEQVVDAEPLATVPGAQGVHETLPLEAAMNPGAHAWHVEAPIMARLGPLKRPGLHARQADRPEVGAYSPKSHSVQPNEAELEENDPIEQLLQRLWPTALANVPGLHTLQLDIPDVEAISPCGQAVQYADPLDGE